MRILLAVLLCMLSGHLLSCSLNNLGSSHLCGAVSGKSYGKPTCEFIQHIHLNNEMAGYKLTSESVALVCTEYTALQSWHSSSSSSIFPFLITAWAAGHLNILAKPFPGHGQFCWTGSCHCSCSCCNWCQGCNKLPFKQRQGR